MATYVLPASRAGVGSVVTTPKASGAFPVAGVGIVKEATAVTATATTWNPSDNQSCTLSGGNLVATSTGANNGVRAIDYVPLGAKTYFEYTLGGTITANAIAVGANLGIATLNYTGGQAVYVNQGGVIGVNAGASGSSLGVSLAAGNVICVALDMSAYLAWFRVGAAGNWNGSGTANPATGTGGVSFTSMAGWQVLWPFVVFNASGATVTANFGASAFTGAVPSGFSGLVPAAAAPTHNILDASTATAGVVRSQGLAFVATSGNPVCRTVGRVASGKYYWEVLDGWWSTSSAVGVVTGNVNLASIGTTPGNCYVIAGGSITLNGAGTGVSLGARSAGDTICIALDATNKLLWFRANAGGNWNNSGTANPATGVGGISLATFGINSIYPICWPYDFSTQIANFGDSTFVGAVPSGFTAGFPNSAPTNVASVTQASVEQFISLNPSAQVTQVSVEQFIALNPFAQLTQLAAETWISPSAPVQLTQIAAEAWVSSGVTDGLYFALPDAVETAAFTMNQIAGPRLSFALADAVENASFILCHLRLLSFSLTDAVEAAHFRIATVGDMFSFALQDVVEAASFTLFETWLPQSAQLPTLSGVGWPVNRRPTWRTIVIEHPSGGDRRTALWPYPLWEFELTIDGLTSSSTQFHALGGTSYQELLGFYLAQGGQLGTFLFFDPDFNIQTGGPCGVGDGTTTAFTFMRTVDGAAEPASWLSSTATPTVYLNGVAQPLSTWRLVFPNNLVFFTAPPAGAVITADFSYLFHCHFAEDTADFEQQMIHLFDLKSLKFRQVRDT